MNLTGKIFRNFNKSVRIISKKNLSSSEKMTGGKETFVAVCQMTSTGDKESNFETVKNLVNAAKEANAKVAFFPEACDFIGGAKKEVFELSEPLNGSLVDRYKELAKVHQQV